MYRKILDGCSKCFARRAILDGCLSYSCVSQSQQFEPTCCWDSSGIVFWDTVKILFSVLLGAVIIRIVGENKENKVHEYVPVNWILSVQAELGTQGEQLAKARNNDGVCVEQFPL